jgi:hypothetical protein
VSTNLTVPARDALQRLTLNASAAVGRRISMSAVLLAALTVAAEYPARITELLELEDSE